MSSSRSAPVAQTVAESPRYTEKELQKMVARARELRSAKKAASEFGVAASTITRAMKRGVGNEEAPEVEVLRADGEIKPVAPHMDIQFAPIDEEAMPEFGGTTEGPPVSEPQPSASSTPPPQAPPQAPITDEATAMGIVAMISGLVDRHWAEEPAEVKAPGPLTDEEKKTLAQAWGPFIAKYAPAMAKYAVEMNMIAVTVMVLGPRWKYSRHIAKQRDEAKRQEATTTNEIVQPDAMPRHVESNAVDPQDVGDKLARRLKRLG